jgi:hypothetical protein
MFARGECAIFYMTGRPDEAGAVRRNLALTIGRSSNGPHGVALAGTLSTLEAAARRCWNR